LREDDKELIKSTVTRSLQDLAIIRNEYVGWAIADALDVYELIRWQRRSWIYRRLTRRPEPRMSIEVGGGDAYLHGA